jgi:hypothetical protein
MVMIDEYSLLVNVGLVTGISSCFCVSLRAGGEGYPVGAFLKFVGEKIGGSKSPTPTSIEYQCIMYSSCH